MSHGHAGVKWMKDSDAPACLGCGVKFTMTKRRHHCRLCGRIFCDACTPYRQDVANEKAVRVCVECVRKQREAHAQARDDVGVPDGVLYTTRSACPTCSINEHRGFSDEAMVPASVFQLQGAVYLEADCQAHGKWTTMVCSNAKFFQRVRRFDVQFAMSSTLSAASGSASAVLDAGDSSDEAEDDGAPAGAGAVRPVSRKSVTPPRPVSTPPAPMPDLEDIHTAPAPLEPHFPTMIDIPFYAGRQFLAEADVERLLKRHKLRAPAGLQFVTRIGGGLVPLDDIPELNRRLVELVRSPLIGQSPVMVDLSFDRTIILAELEDSVFLQHGHVYPSIRYFLQPGDEQKCIDELLDTFGALETFNEMQFSVVLCVDEPLPDLSKVMQILLAEERRGVIRLVTISRERSPKDVMDRVKPSGASEPIFADGQVASSRSVQRRSAGGGSVDSASARGLPSAVESTDPYAVLQKLGVPALTPDDFVPARVGMVLEPILKATGYGDFQIRPAGMCGFVACLGPDGSSLSRMIDVEKFFHGMIPVTQRMKREKPGMWTGKAIRRVLHDSAKARLPDLVGFLSDSKNEAVVAEYVHKLQFVLVHNNMDFASIDMSRRRHCSVISGNACVAACTGCV